MKHIESEVDLHDKPIEVQGPCEVKVKVCEGEPEDEMLYAVINNKLSKHLKIEEGSITVEPLKRHKMLMDMNKNVLPEIVDPETILPSNNLFSDNFMFKKADGLVYSR